MRIVIFGAGAVGSVIGGRLFQHAEAHGHEIALVARGPHCEAIRANGLTINDTAGSVTLAVPVFEQIDDVALGAGDVVMMTMKSQDTGVALEQLSSHAPTGVRVVCAQNGVENERAALRRFANVYAMCIMLPASFMHPGVVDATGAPLNAILDVGRYPTGTDATSEKIAAALTASNLSSRSTPDVMRWKYRKLMLNLANAADALVADRENMSLVVEPARREAEACFEAAGIDKASTEDDRARRAGLMEHGTVGSERGGGSTWQSLARGATTTEVDWLNGEIVLLGRLHAISTPMNEMLCEVARWAAANGVVPRSLTTSDLLARL
jgi:2-dehydropantoate 2-reductase